MATNLSPVKCKSCVRTLATVSDNGLISDPLATESHGCDTCQRFRALFDAMQAADDAYKSFSDRRDTYRPKQDALAEVKKTHLELNNWLIGVEAVREGTGSTLFDGDRAQEHEKITTEDEQSGVKQTSKARSVASSPTQCRSANRKPARKRLKFSKSVEFREDYRSSESYYRNGESYVSGRYAAPKDTEHLDTSGSAKTFLKFTNMKKVGKVWVDIWKDEGEVEHLEQPAPTDSIVIGEIPLKDMLLSIQEQATQADAAPADARSQRLARRNSNNYKATSLREKTAARTQVASKKRTTLASRKITEPALQPADSPNNPVDEAMEVDTRTIAPNVESEEPSQIFSSVASEGGPESLAAVPPTASLHQSEKKYINQDSGLGSWPENGNYKHANPGERNIVLDESNSLVEENLMEDERPQDASPQWPGYNAATTDALGAEVTKAANGVPQIPFPSSQKPASIVTDSSNAQTPPVGDETARHTGSLYNIAINTSEDKLVSQQVQKSLQDSARGQAAQFNEFGPSVIEFRGGSEDTRRSANQLDLSGPHQKNSYDALFSAGTPAQSSCATHRQTHPAGPGANM